MLAFLAFILSSIHAGIKMAKLIWMELYNQS